MGLGCGEGVYIWVLGVMVGDSSGRVGWSISAGYILFCGKWSVDNDNAMQ